MAYTLGPVKPHVKAAAEEVGAQFNVSRISGFGSRANNYSDHPLGLALDFSARSAAGDAIANYVLANWERLSVKYVIWEQRVWYPPPNGQWKLMENRGSDSANHFDHVHVSFNATPGSGGAAPIIDQTGFTNPVDAIQDFLAAMRGISTALGWISNSQNWVRVGEVTLGAILLLIAVMSWDKVKATGASAARNAATQVKGVVKNVR